MLASQKRGTLYTGVTSNLVKRIYEHKNNMVAGFTKDYKVHNLVYYEATNDVESALTKEKRIKRWKRAWQIELIEQNNSDWKDLYPDLL